MAATTLVTFLLYGGLPTAVYISDVDNRQTARSVSTVHLYGSWDNFTKPYSMQRDLKLARGHWRGCYSFTDIICDGENVHTAQKRSGGLLEGGMYWYYYQLDGDTEIHDECQPCTNACPFLPGQTVNILDVPMQDRSGLHSNRERSISTSSAVYTMDPQDKFRALKPPVLQKPERTSEAIDCSVKGDRRPSTPTTGMRPATAILSPKTVANPFIDNPPVSSHQNVRPQTASLLDLDSSAWVMDTSLRPYTTGMLPDHWDLQDFIPLEDETADLFAEPVNDSQLWQRLEKREGHPSENHLLANTAANDLGAPKQTVDVLARKDQFLPEQGRPEESSQTWPTSTSHSDILHQPANEGADANVSNNNYSLSEMPSHPRSLQHTFSISSTRTSAFFSSVTSGSELDGPDPCVRHSQPLTPTRTEEFGGDVLLTTTWATPEHHIHNQSPSGFESDHLHSMNVYSLPEAETASALTLQNLETATVKTSNGDLPGARAVLVEAWNDGSEHRKTGLQELMDDLGYLGALIG